VLRGERGVHAVVAQWVRGRPDALAVQDVSHGVTLSYTELWAAAGRVARMLAAHGVHAGDVVAVALDRSSELVSALLGILRAGAVYLPLDPQAPAARVRTVLTDAAARYVIASPGRRAELPGTGGPVVLDVPVDGPADFTDSAAGGDDPCYLMYTSGSTGIPKGVVVPHRAVVRLVTRAHYCVVSPGDRCANTANPAFDATTFEIWAALAAGGTVVVIPSVLEMSFTDWADLVRRERIDTMFLTTSVFHTVARENPAAFATLGNLVVGGEQLEMPAVRAVLAEGPPRRLVNGYGPTETTTFAAAFDCTPAGLAGLDRIPVGFPLQDTGLHILDDQLDPVAPGAVGELCVSGPGVALGYLNRPELTAERFVREPSTGTRIYRTGDLARMLPTGAVEVLGRRDDQVKLRGFRIELGEIEQVLLATGLCDNAVVRKIGAGSAAFLAAFVLPARSAPQATLVAELTAAVTERLPGYMVPARWQILERFPLGPTGKVDAGRLVALLGTPGTASGPAAPAGELVDAVRQIWLDVLAVPDAGPGDNFLDLGGNSVTAVQVAARIQHHLDLPVEPADVLLADSLADLVHRLGAGTGVAS
jgi:amino acid adenylation domain-containing protein